MLGLGRTAAVGMTAITQDVGRFRLAFAIGTAIFAARLGWTAATRVCALLLGFHSFSWQSISVSIAQVQLPDQDDLLHDHQPDSDAGQYVDGFCRREGNRIQISR